MFQHSIVRVDVVMAVNEYQTVIQLRYTFTCLGRVHVIIHS